MGLNSAYNDIQAWNYRHLPQVFGGEADVQQVSSDQELKLALAKAAESMTDKLCLIEVLMDKYKQPPALEKLAAIVAAQKAGPNKRENI